MVPVKPYAALDDESELFEDGLDGDAGGTDWDLNEWAGSR
jgi:hypothetical protein